MRRARKLRRARATMVRMGEVLGAGVWLCDSRTIHDVHVLIHVFLVDA